MGHFRFFLEGENFPLPQEGSDEMVNMGWYATRWVEAETMDQAIAAVIQQVRRHPTLAIVPQGRGAMVTVHEAKQISPGQAGPARDSLSLYRMVEPGVGPRSAPSKLPIL